MGLNKLGYHGLDVYWSTDVIHKAMVMSRADMIDW